ncbi:MAG TPA: metallophosphoesterase family protein [Solirubrobacteraceae bacterium]|jgi:predicted phosphodiesterase|nr:metallophosphoesterase family protein [Solirubrobacteraceae bacterium]
MRYAVLADVHANLHALDAVLAVLEPERPDRWVVAGDLVGYGPHPDECVERLLELDPVRVAGNHDLIARGRLSAQRCIPLARESLEWTAATIGPETGAALDALPPLAGEGELVVAHGSLDDPEEYVRTPEAAQAQLELLRERRPGARVLVLGHTHRPLAVAAGAGALPATGTLALQPGERYVLNPGSVGQSRARVPVARAMVLDLAAGEARFLDVDYDVEACAAALRARGLDPLSCHLPPAPFPGAYRLRRVARRALGRRPRPGAPAGGSAGAGPGGDARVDDPQA